MEQIPSLYWMITIGVVAFFVCLVLLYIALLFKESTDLVKESRDILKTGKESILKLARIIEDLESTVSMARNTVSEITSKVLVPFKAISGIVESFERRAEKRKESTDPLDELLNE
jgi:hypothetical protein